MAESYLWGPGNVTNPALLATTAKFNNGSVGDKTQGETVTNSPPVTIVANEITGMIDFGEMVDVVEVTVTYGSTGFTGNDGSHGSRLVVEYDDGTWHQFGTHTNFDIANDSTGFASYITTTFPCNAPAFRIRAYLVGSFQQSGPISVTTGISDFRATVESSSISIIVPQGRVRSGAPTGSTAPDTPGVSWEIQKAGFVIATSAVPVGWAVAFDGSQISVRPPGDAQIAIDYEVRWLV